MGSAKGACHSEMSLRKELLYVCAVIATKKKTMGWKPRKWTFCSGRWLHNKGALADIMRRVSFPNYYSIFSRLLQY